MIKFNVEIKDVEKINPLFSRCKVYICYSDLNRNNSIINKQLINKKLHTLFGCPIVGQYSKEKNDFTDHGGKLEIENGEIKYVVTTIPYGFVPESSEIKWEYINGKDYLTCTGYLWSSRYPEVLSVLEEGRPQSMELDEVSGEWNDKNQFVITDFCFSALCILGKDVEPCFEDAKIISYSLNKNEFKNEFTQMLHEFKNVFNGGDNLHIEEFIKKEDMGTGNKITIDNSKESADTSTSWGSVNKTKLRNDILKASNYKSLVKEAYLIVEDGWEDAPSEKLKYPHHVIKDGKLVVSESGCQAALQRLHQQGITSGSAINHLKKHYRELGLDMSAFQLSNEGDGNVNKTKGEIAAQFKLTANQLYDELSRVLSEVKYEMEDWFGETIEVNKYYLRDFDESFVYAVDREKGYIDVKIPYSMNGDDVVFDYENVKRIKYVPMDWEGSDDVNEDDLDVDQYALVEKLLKEAKDQFDRLFAQKDAVEKDLHSKEETILSMNEKYNLLEQQIVQKDEEISQLKEFKLKYDEKLANERNEKIEAIFNRYSAHLTSEEINSFKEKENQYNSIDDLEKEIRSFIFDRIEAKINNSNNNKFNHINIGLPQNKNNNSEPKSQSVWDRLSTNK